MCHGLYTRILLIDEEEQSIQVFRQIREVEESILFLPDVYKGRLDARHNAPNPTHVNVAQGTRVFRVFEIEFSQLAIFHDGDAGLIFFCVDDNLFAHMEGRCARSPGGRSSKARG